MNVSPSEYSLEVKKNCLRPLQREDKSKMHATYVNDLSGNTESLQKSSLIDFLSNNDYKGSYIPSHPHVQNYEIGQKRMTGLMRPWEYKQSTELKQIPATSSETLMFRIMALGGKGKLEKMEALIKKGANLNQRNNKLVSSSGNSVARRYQKEGF